MKAKHLLSIVGLGLFAAVSVGAGIALSRSADSHEVNAAAPTEDVVRYFSVDDAAYWWTGGAETNKVWVYGHEDSANYPDKFVATEHLGGNVFKFTLPAGYPNFIAEASSSTDDWIKQSYAIAYEPTINHYILHQDSGNLYSYEQCWLKYAPDANARTFYFDLTDQGWWHNDSAKTYIYYVGLGSSWRVMQRIPDSNIFKTTIVSPYIQKFLFVRTDSTEWTGSFDEHVWNQTKDINYTYSNEDCRWVKAGAADPSDSNKLNVIGFEEVTLGSYANGFARQFLNTDLCYDAGGLHSDFDTNWSVLSNAFGYLKLDLYYYNSQDLLNYFSTASSEGSTDVALAMYKYDMIRAKNPDHDPAIDNFLDRNLVSYPSISPSIFGNKVDTTTSIGIIAVIAIASVSAICVLVVYKKKRHN